MENQELNYDYTPNISYKISNKYGEFWLDINNAPFEAPEIRSYISGLKDRWLTETKILSNPRLKYENESFKQILKLGYYALPYLIDDLENNSTDWFFALNSITMQNPIKNEHQGIYDLMKEDWLEWVDKNMKNQYGDRNFRYA